MKRIIKMNEGKKKWNNERAYKHRKRKIKINEGEKSKIRKDYLYTWNVQLKLMTARKKNRIRKDEGRMKENNKERSFIRTKRTMNMNERKNKHVK